MEHDHMIEAFATNGTDHPLDVGSLPRRARCRRDFANARVSHVFSEVIAKDRIAVAQEVARELGKGKCLAQLLSGPICANECRWRPVGILYGHGDTESGPASAGGAVVTLSSSNAAASVPSSVTVPAGSTSATFTVNTPIVLISTSATISASYNNTTQSASLAILL